MSTTLKQFITNIRQAKDSSDESKKVQEELQYIFEQLHKNELINGNTPVANKNRRKYISKLMYIQLAGYSIYPPDVKGKEEIINLGIEQCLVLLNSQLSNYTEANEKDGVKVDVDSNLKELKSDREIGYIGLKTLFNEFITKTTFESIVNSVLIDISSAIVFQNQNKNKNKNLSLSFWIIVSMGLQSVNELLLWITDLSTDTDLTFLREFISTILELLNKDKMFVPECFQTRTIMFIAQLFKLNNLKELQNDILTRSNLALVGKTLARTNLNDNNIIVSLCSLFEKWVVFDWEGIKSLEGLLVTKLTEISEVVKAIEFENNEHNIKNFDWILKYGYMIIAIFKVLSHLTTISIGNGKVVNMTLKSTVDRTISNCVGTNAKLLIDKHTNNLQYQYIVASILFSALELYINDVDNNGEFNPKDAATAIESLITFLQFNDDINIRISCLEKLVSILNRTRDYGYGFKVILAEISMWKKFIREKDLYVCKLTTEILFIITNSNVSNPREDLYNQIKDVLIILMYYLQKCKSSERSDVLTKILLILETYKGIGIIQEISKKLLKLFIMIANCNEDSWIKIYDLIIYSINSSENITEITDQLIGFIIKGLSVECCDNFVKLSCLVLKYNVEHLKIGDLDLQLKLLFDKYENGSLLTKLLILDTMDSYYKVSHNEKMQNLIKLAFKQEMNSNNIEIKQRAHEYYILHDMNIILDDSDEMDINKLESLPAFNKAVAKNITSPTIKLSDNWEDGYIRSLRFDQGILYDSSDVRIFFRVKRDKKWALVELNYKLKFADDKIDNNIKMFNCRLLDQIENNKFYDITIVENKGIENLETKTGKFTLKYTIKEMYPEDYEPILQFEAPMWHSPLNLKISLALKLLHTSEGNKMSLHTFQSRWNQIGQFMSPSGCDQRDLATVSNDANVEMLVRILKKMNFEIIAAEFNSSKTDFNVAGASILSFPNKAVGCLCVITSARVEVRCTEERVVCGLCDRIVSVLGRGQ